MKKKIDIWKDQNLKKNNNLDNSKDNSLTNTDKGIISLKNRNKPKNSNY